MALSCTGTLIGSFWPGRNTSSFAFVSWTMWPLSSFSGPHASSDALTTKQPVSVSWAAADAERWRAPPALSPHRMSQTM